MFKTFLSEFEKGIQGEEKTIMFLLLVISSKWLNNAKPLSFHTLLNSESGTGKDYILQTVFKLIEPKDYTGFTRISARALDYLEPNKVFSDSCLSWNGKFLGLEDIESDILNSSTLKVFLSNGSKTAIVTDRGVITTKHKGCPVILMTSAYSDPNQELMRRINILGLDESDKQTYDILMRQSCDNFESIDYNSLRKLISKHKKYDVVVPFAKEIANNISHSGTHMRTFYPRFIDFIKACTVFNQKERKVIDKKLVSTIEDYNIVKDLFENLSLTMNFNPLSKSKKDMLHDLIYEFEGGWFNCKDACRIMNISYKSMLNNVKKFIANGLVEQEIRRDEYSNKPVYYYKPKEPEKLKLPELENGK